MQHLFESPWTPPLPAPPHFTGGSHSHGWMDLVGGRGCPVPTLCSCSLSNVSWRFVPAADSEGSVAAAEAVGSREGPPRPWPAAEHWAAALAWLARRLSSCNQLLSGKSCGWGTSLVQEAVSLPLAAGQGLKVPVSREHRLCPQVPLAGKIPGARIFWALNDSVQSGRRPVPCTAESPDASPCMIPSAWFMVVEDGSGFPPSLLLG